MERNPNLTAAYLQGAVEKAVKQAARDTVMLNARREKNARWARIPAGDACGFCEMCGSRGFVYASEESAAGEWHPFCNCQVAIAFDPIEGEGGEVSQELRDYDPEALYEDYKARLAKYKKGARYRDYTSPVRLKAESFEAAMRELSEARTLDELHDVGDRIARKWHKNGRRPDPEQWREMSRHAQELERGFAERNTVSGVSAAVDPEVRAWAKQFPNEELWVQRENGEPFYKKGSPTEVSTSEKRGYLF